MIQRPLFFSGNVFDLMQKQKEELRDMVYHASPHSLNDPELPETLVEKCELAVPVLDDANKYARTRAVDIDVSRDPSRRFYFGEEGPNYVKGQEITIHIPYRGDGRLFDVRPATFDTNPPRGEVQGNELVLSREVLSNDANAGQEIQRTIESVKKYLDWLRPSSQALKADLQRQSQELVARRRREEEASADILDSLGIPIRNEPTSPKSAPPTIKRESQHRRTRQHTKEWDVFISHASEDKEEIARPLADALEGRGLSVWYDEFSLKLGDSLRQAIDKGLSGSRFGVVILSRHFFEKHWPQQELNGLATREINGKRMIIPVWHKIGFDEVRAFSPTLADRVAVGTEKGLSEVVRKIVVALE